MRASVPHTLERKHLTKCEGYEQPHIVKGLYRWSAVVRGAVDTGCGRNHSGLEVSEQFVFLEGRKEDEKDYSVAFDGAGRVHKRRAGARAGGNGRHSRKQ